MTSNKTTQQTVQNALDAKFTNAYSGTQAKDKFAVVDGVKITAASWKLLLKKINDLPATR